MAPRVKFSTPRFRGAQISTKGSPLCFCFYYLYLCLFPAFQDWALHQQFCCAKVQAHGQSQSGVGFCVLLLHRLITYSNFHPTKVATVSTWEWQWQNKIMSKWWSPLQSSSLCTAEPPHKHRMWPSSTAWAADGMCAHSLGTLKRNHIGRVCGGTSRHHCNGQRHTNWR